MLEAKNVSVNYGKRHAVVSVSLRVSPGRCDGSQFAAVVTQRIGRRGFVNFDLTATSDYLAPIFPRVYRFRSLIKGDVGVSYELPLTERRRLRFFGYVDNLFNRDNFESGFRTPGRTGRGGASLSF
jgi:hypothetical protein